MRIYLAGPMTGYPQFNFPRFDAAEANLQKRGYDVVAPADLHDEAVRAEALASPDGSLGSVSSVSWGECLAQDVRLIADTGVEAIVCLSGWERSRGARLEAFVGRLCGLPVLRFSIFDPMQPVGDHELRAAFGGVA